MFYHIKHTTLQISWFDWLEPDVHICSHSRRHGGGVEQSKVKSAWVAALNAHEAAVKMLKQVVS